MTPDARIVVGKANVWFPAWQDGRASRLYKHVATAGKTLSIIVFAPDSTPMTLHLPTKIASGDLTALVTIEDNDVTVSLGDATTRIHADATRSQRRGRRRT